MIDRHFEKAVIFTASKVLNLTARIHCVFIQHLSPQFKFMVFHIFRGLDIHHLRVYYELTRRPALNRLDNSVGNVLMHRYRGGHGLETHSIKAKFFQALIFHNCTSCVYTLN